MKVIVTGGGTGGHIYPAVSLIEELKNKEDNIEILYIGKKNSLEEKIIKKLGYDFKGIRAEGLPRKNNKKSFIMLKELIAGLKESKRIIKEFNPDFVIGTGGFVTGPVLFMANRQKYNIYFHEQNSYPGITNKILSRFANKYFVTFEESIKYFKNQDRAVVTGNPIRNKFKNIESLKNSTIEEYSLDKEIKTVFSFGGSNGATILNENILELVNNLDFSKEFQIIHVTGMNHFEDFMGKLENKNKNIIKVFPYLDDIQKAYSVADLAITSSGAITLAELAFLGLPSILIPKSYTTENHQVHNAREYEKNNASKVILEKDLDYKKLYKEIVEITGDEELLGVMRKSVKILATPNAAEDIIEHILKDIR